MTASLPCMQWLEEPGPRGEHEGGVAFELGQSEAGLEGGDDHTQEIREDVVGMLQLDIGEIAGVAGDVGDEEASGLCRLQLPRTLPGASSWRPPGQGIA